MRPERAPSPRPSLASMQEAVMSSITGRGGGLVAADARALIVSDARASAADRLQAYAHMYRARIAEALEAQFPRLAKRLGADAFAALASAYIDDEPSRHPSLRQVGERLPAWMAARRPASPRLAGLAHLEWARADVFDRADDPTLSLEAVRAWPTERFGELPLRLVAAHRLVTAPAGTARLWDALGADPVDGGDDAPDSVGAESLVVWREATVVYHRLVDAAEHAALERAAQGTRFGIVCESLLAARGEDAAVAQAYGWLSTWLADGLLENPT